MPYLAAPESYPNPIAKTTTGPLPLRLWDYGGEGPRVLLLHGYLDSGRSYDFLASCLLPGHRVFSLDWRGHGESPLPPGASAHLLDHVKDLFAHLSDVDGRDAGPDVVVAHSMAANIALLLAGATPELVPRLLLLDGLGGVPEDPEDQPARLEQVLRATVNQRPFSVVNSLAEAVDRIRRFNPGLSELGARRMAWHVLRPTDDNRFEFCFPPSIRGPTPVRFPEEMWSSLFRRITATVNVVRAENGFVGDGEPFVLRALNLRTQIETWHGLGHHLHVEVPERVAEATQRLLRYAPHSSFDGVIR